MFRPKPRKQRVSKGTKIRQAEMLAGWMAKREHTLYVGQRGHAVWHILGPGQTPLCGCARSDGAIVTKTLDSSKERVCQTCEQIADPNRLQRLRDNWLRIGEGTFNDD